MASCRERSRNAAAADFFAREFRRPGRRLGEIVDGGALESGNRRSADPAARR